MADTYEDKGDVSTFETPPKHPEQIAKDIKEAKNKLLDFLMEDMSDYLENDISGFMLNIGNHLGFIGRINTSEAEIAKLINQLNIGVRHGIEDAEESIAESLDNE